MKDNEIFVMDDMFAFDKNSLRTMLSIIYDAKTAEDLLENYFVNDEEDD